MVDYIYNEKILRGVSEVKTTMVIYESHHGSAKKAAMILGTVIGNTKVYDVGEAPETIKFNSIVIVFGFYGSGTAEGTLEYLEKIKELIGEKPVAVIGIGLSQIGFPAICEKIKKAAGKNELDTFFSEGELRISELTHGEREQLEIFYKKFGMTLMDKGNFDFASVIDISEKLALKYKTPIEPVPKELLKNYIEKFINEHNTLALATGKDGWVRCTPLDYVYMDGMFYIISEGGLKCKGIWQNENVSACIYDIYQTMENLKGMQITGMATFVEPFGKEYNKVFAARNISVEKIDQMPCALYLIKICPVKYEILNSDFNKDGYDVKQVLEINDKFIEKI